MSLRVALYIVLSLRKGKTTSTNHVFKWVDKNKEWVNLRSPLKTKDGIFDKKITEEWEPEQD